MHHDVLLGILNSHRLCVSLRGICKQSFLCEKLNLNVTTFKSYLSTKTERVKSYIIFAMKNVFIVLATGPCSV